MPSDFDLAIPSILGESSVSSSEELSAAVRTSTSMLSLSSFTHHRSIAHKAAYYAAISKPPSLSFACCSFYDLRGRIMMTKNTMKLFWITLSLQHVSRLTQVE